MTARFKKNTEVYFTWSTALDKNPSQKLTWSASSFKSFMSKL